MSQNGIAWLNGQWTSPQEAHVSVLDRGFLFGDGIYEVIPVYNGKAFRLEQHLQRLSDSMAATSITNPHSDDAWTDLLETLIARNDGGNQALYLQITRGVQPARDHRLPDDVAATVFAMSSPLALVPDDVRQNGASAITRPDIRWQWCHIKSTSLLANVLLKHEATAVGANECLLLRDGMVTEGSTSNVFIVKDQTICTPPKSSDLLPGITRDLIIELAQGLNITVQERAITEDELRSADEVWISSSTRELYPITSIDDAAVATSKPGTMWAKLYDALQTYKQNY